MVIYTVIRYSPVGVHSSYTNSSDAVKTLRRLANETNSLASDDGWECWDVSKIDRTLAFKVEETYLFGIEDKEDYPDLGRITGTDYPDDA